MPFGDIQIIPGVNTVATPTLNKAGVSASNLIRWRMGLPEKQGGWQRYVANTMGSITRSLMAWQDANGSGWLGAGNLSSLKAINGGVVQDITPQIKHTNVVLNLSTTRGSYTIQIIDTGINNLTQYDAVFFNTPVSVGGLILAGLYQVLSGSGTGFSIEAREPALTTVANGGSVPLFTTTVNDSAVLVTFADHGLTAGEHFYFPIPTIVNGITISGSYEIFSATANTFSITASNVATASGSASMNGGQVQYLHYLAVGPASSVSSGAIGPIGQFAIGEGYNVITTLNTQQGTPITATDWSQDNWGEIQLSCARGGPIFYWRPGSGFQTAVPVGNAPPQNNGIFISTPQQILVAWGSAANFAANTMNTVLDPLIVRWSDNVDFTSWVATSQTSAGSFRLSTGSRIVGGIQAAKVGVIFTDVDVWSMNFVDYPIVFGFEQISTGNGLIGPHAVVSVRGTIYWMSNNNFCMFAGGGVVTIPCAVWDNVFQDLDTANASKCVAAANIDFNEVVFYYPSLSGGTGECDKYAKLNVSEQIWDVGSMPRSAWVGRSVLGKPIGADPTTQLLQQHETGYDDDGAAMNSYFETGYAVIGDGENFAIVDHFIPDMKYTTVSGSTSVTLSVTITALNYPSGGSTTTNVLTMTSTTEYLSPRLRGRQMKWRVESNDLGTWWRQGNPRYRYAPGGRR